MDQCNIHGNPVTKNSDMLLMAARQKAVGPPRMFEIMKETHKSLKLVTQKSKNFGRKGGWLVVDFLTFSNGDPTGYTRSQVVYFNIPN